MRELTAEELTTETPKEGVMAGLLWWLGGRTVVVGVLATWGEFGPRRGCGVRCVRSASLRWCSSIAMEAAYEPPPRRHARSFN
jgi:hypothetical protein